MAVVVSKTYEFSHADIFSKTFAIVESPMILSLDGPGLNTLSRVSSFFYNLLKNPLIWQHKAQELGLVFSDARQEVRAFCEMRESKRGTYAFAAALLGTLSPTEFRKIPYIGLGKPSGILINWPPGATIITGLKWETYLHKYMPYMAFSVMDRSSYTEKTCVILVIEKTTKVSEARKEYLGRLLGEKPCGSWHNGQETTPRLKGHKSVVSLCTPSHHEYFNSYAGNIMPFRHW